MTTGSDPMHLMSGYFAGILEEPDVAELEAWINASPDHANHFARFAVEQRAMEKLLRADRDGHLAQLQMNDFALDDTDADHTIDLKALAEMEAHAATGPIFLEERLARGDDGKQATPNSAVDHGESDTRRRVIIIPRPVFWAAIAAVMLLTAWMGYEVVRPAPGPGSASVGGQVDPPDAPAQPAVVARLEAADNAAWSGPSRPRVDQAVTQGEYQLAEGTARFRFNNDALVIVEAPARITLRSGHEMVLHEGKLVGYCSEQAHGFTVTTPHAQFVDLGTEFGVSVDPWLESQLHVFKGAVRAETIPGDDGRPNRAIVVRASEAVSATPTSPISLMDQGASIDRFLTTRPVSVPVFSTGRVVGPEGDDAHWKITAVDGKPLPQPVPASLFEPPPPSTTRPYIVFLENQPEQLAWLNLAPKYRGLLEGSDRSLTFTTQFDLGPMDPETAELVIRFLADNFVSEVRLNGKPIPVPEHSQRPPFTQLTELRIQSHFVEGINTLDLTAHNDEPNGEANHLAFIAELSATAQLPWYRDTHDNP